MSQTHLQEQIDVIARHEQEFLAGRTRSERLSDNIASSVGSLPFVGVHTSVFLLWMGWNSLRSTRHFDPAPFSLLGTLVALEGILLASFILMRQARMARRAEERDHLMLQVLLLTEKELTASLTIDREIAGQIGLEKTANDPNLKELSQHTSIDEVAHTIKESLSAPE